MKVQAALPFENRGLFDFEHFLGNETTKASLENFQDLPQFSYLYGSHYIGKTHLLGALSQAIQSTDRVHIQLSSQNLKDTDLAVVLPLKLDFVLIDDVSDLAGNAGGELALFNFFNHCKSHMIKLIVSGRIHPKDKGWQLPDLVSRINSGLTLKLEELMGESAYQCIRNQFEFNGIPVDEVVFQYLKTRFSNSYSKLYQLYLKIAVESLQQKRKVTVPLVKSLMAKLDSEVS